jgi:tetratricopeptide (TPR) repeat protein
MTEKLDQLIEQARTAYNDEDYPQAAELFKTVETRYKTTGDSLSAAEMANNRSVALLKANDPAAALKAVEGTDTVFEAAGDTRRQAMALANKAAALESLKKYPDALEIYEKSSELLKQIGDGELRAYVLKCISAIQLRQGKQFEAIATMQASLDNKPSPGIKDRFMKRLIEQVFNLMRR